MAWSRGKNRRCSFGSVPPLRLGFGDGSLILPLPLISLCFRLPFSLFFRFNFPFHGLLGLFLLRSTITSFSLLREPRFGMIPSAFIEIAMRRSDWARSLVPQLGAEGLGFRDYLSGR
ncbi:hypothetical protein K469DRAFT_366317 [Zopfia rhizophila CBS 207.26]|uniref:Uncharacterized protein n=1 Tax=Zopfia rhizophila CBS 207.26 TaxID=1314779 RepID=A0A6A6EIE5_9PEZI|nr:hypothetical protein K469DRAFT_366317 [Zopfia rhizophila CBS 207.26]